MSSLFMNWNYNITDNNCVNFNLTYIPMNIYNIILLLELLMAI